MGQQWLKEIGNYFLLPYWEVRKWANTIVSATPVLFLFLLCLVYWLIALRLKQNYSISGCHMSSRQKESWRWIFFFAFWVSIFGEGGGSDTLPEDCHLDKESACNSRDLGSMPGLGRSPGEGNDFPLQYSCLENPTDRGSWQATVRGVTKSRNQLSDGHFHFQPEIAHRPIIDHYWLKGMNNNLFPVAKEGDFPLCNHRISAWFLSNQDFLFFLFFLQGSREWRRAVG